MMKIKNFQQAKNRRFSSMRKIMRIWIIAAFFLLMMQLVSADFINSTQADGLVVYQTLNNATPLFRSWNESNNFTTVQVSPLNGGADISWMVLRGNHERDEMIMGVEDQDNDVNIYIFNASDEWSNQLEVSADVPNSAYRAFDIAVEDVSGDVLMVYENTSVADSQVQYRVWNGTGYTTEQNITTGLTADAISWVTLESRAGTDQIMLLVHNSAGDLFGIPWNGTNFIPSHGLTLSTGTTSSTEQHFGFAWEEVSGQGLVFYGEADLTYRTYDPLGGFGGAENTIATGAIDAFRACSESTSDHIGFIWQDSGNDVSVRVWDGTQVLATPPTEDDRTEPSAGSNVNVDCGWFNSTTALFGFSDVSGGATGLLSMDYFNFTKPNTWSVGDLTTAPTTATFASDDIEGVRFMEHPTTREIMIVAMDVADDISLVRWNGTGFASIAESPVETDTEVANGDQEGVMFDWYRFDPVPNVTLVNPDGPNYDEDATVDINATVKENILVDTVLANITLPNGSIKQVTLANGSGNNTHFNLSFSVTDLNGIYTVRIIANDTSAHSNINSSQTTTFSIGDFIAPNVTNSTPFDNTSFEFQGIFEIATNATDGSNISKVFANITLPNGSIYRIELLNQTPTNTTAKYNTTFNVTDVHGSYHMRIIANDTKNNRNTSEFTTFIVGDILIPNVTNLTPAAGTDYELNALVNITANVTDNANVSTVVANVTLPNGSISQLTLLNSTAVHYNGTFSVTSLEGTYTIRIIANDSANLINSTETTTFTMGDNIAPNVTINAPANNTNFSISWLLFNFTATDTGYATLNCSIYINDTINQTNTSVGGSQLTTFNVTGFIDSHFNWTVSCNDTAAHVNTSTVRYFSVDTASPSFNSLTTTPSLEPGLDPNLNVSVFANVTDNTTAVHTVVFQYKLSNNTDYTNLTMVYNTGDSLYNASFNATQNGTYNLRLWANDTVGNPATSATTNILVQFDRNWTRAPAVLPAVRTSLNLNVSLGNITINNTGDYAVHFNITSDSTKTYFNDSSNFTVLANSVKQMEVLDNGTVAGVKTITLNITTNDTRATPASQTTTASIVVAEGQPVFVSTFTTPSTSTLSVEQGETGVEFVADIENIGEGNATDVVFHFRIPDDWTLTFGTLSDSTAEFNSGDKETRTIRVTIPSDFAEGDYVVFANATGVNGSSYNISDANLTFGSTVTVTVGAPEALGSTGGSSSSPSTSGTTSGTTTGGGSGGTVAKKSYGSITETIESTSVFSVVRGSGEATPIAIANLYENSVMENIELEAVGFLGQYVVVSPPVELSGITNMQLVQGKSESFAVAADGKTHELTVDELFESTVKVTIKSEPQQLTLKKDKSRFVDVNGDGIGDVALRFIEAKGKSADIRVYQVRDLTRTKLGYGEQMEYFLDINAPSYLTRSDFELELMITADVVAINETAAGFASKLITEFRKLLFQVREVDEEDVRADVERANAAIRELIDAGFSVGAVQGLLVQVDQALEDGNFELAAELIDRIIETKDQAFAAHDAILQAQEQIKSAREKWLSIPQTEEALQLALIAFERGDFSTALERARAAQLQYVLETKGRINLLWLVVNYWWALIVGTIAALSLLYFIYKYSIIMIVNQRIHNLNKEEDTIGILIKETQKKYLVNKVLSAGQYKRYIANYEKRLTRIQQLRVKLRNRRVAILRTEQGLENIQREKKEISALLRKNQIDYLVKGAISKGRFDDVYKENKGRLTEIEHEEAILEERLAQESGTARYSLLAFVSHVIEWLFGKRVEKRKRQSKVQEHKTEEEKDKHEKKFKTVHFKKSKPLPVHEKVRHIVKKHVSTIKDRSPIVRNVHSRIKNASLKHASLPSGKKKQKEWINVTVPESVKLLTYCEKTGLELPWITQPKHVFDERSREAFDQELMRIAGSVQQEPGKETTYLETLSPPKKPGRLSEEELRKWYPGAFEDAKPRKQVKLETRKPNEISAVAKQIKKQIVKFNPELLDMLRSNIHVKKQQQRNFINNFDMDLLRMARAGHKIVHAERKHFLKSFDKDLLGMMGDKK